MRSLPGGQGAGLLPGRLLLPQLGPLWQVGGVIGYKKLSARSSEIVVKFGLLVKFGPKNDLTPTKPCLYFSSSAGPQPSLQRWSSCMSSCLPSFPLSLLPSFLPPFPPSFHPPSLLVPLPSTHLINNYSLSPSYIPGTVLGTGAYM